MPPFIYLRSQAKDLGDDCIKPAFRRTTITIVVIMIISKKCGEFFGKSDEVQEGGANL